MLARRLKVDEAVTVNMQVLSLFGYKVNRADLLWAAVWEQTLWASFPPNPVDEMTK